MHGGVKIIAYLQDGPGTRVLRSVDLTITQY